MSTVQNIVFGFCLFANALLVLTVLAAFLDLILTCREKPAAEPQKKSEKKDTL